MFGFLDKLFTRRIESKMASWLAHPAEFGIAPTSVVHKRTHVGRLIGHGVVTIHLVDYEMPDGTKGRGFVNGPLTWSFLGDEINAISDADLLLAYCGWAWLFPALQAGKVQTDFVSEGEDARLIARKQEDGLADIKLGSRFKIDTSEFEFEATKQGQVVKGAGDSSADVTFEGADPRMALPCIYFFLGGQVIQDMKTL